MEAEKQPTFAELLAKAYAAPDPYPFLFEVGQTVRIRNKVFEDGQTHRSWVGAKATVLKRTCTGIHKEHWYTLENQQTKWKDEFREDELDRRWSRWKPSGT